MKSKVDFKIYLNKEILKLRSVYLISIFVILFVLKVLLQDLMIFPLFLILVFIIVYFSLNFVVKILVYKMNNESSRLFLNLVSFVNILFDFFLFVFLVYIIGGSLQTFSFLVFLIPILTSALVVGTWGAFFFAFLSAIFFFLLLSLYNLNPDFFVFGSFFSACVDLRRCILTISSFSLSYFAMAWLGVFFSYIILDREKEVIKKLNKITKENKLQNDEIKMIDDTANSILERDVELAKINEELDEKIHDLEKAEKSQIRSFRDLQEARKKTDYEKYKIDAIISNFIDPIIVLDDHDKIIILNKPATNIFGLSQKLVGEKIASHKNYSMGNFTKFIQGEFKLKNAAELKIEDDNIEEIEISRAGKDLTYKIITTKVVGKNGDFLGTMKIFYNLTREKMIDKLKSEFISIAAHQLRTPLSAIKWVIKMVLDGDAGELNEEQQDLLFKGYRSNERIIKLVNDMLNVSRIEEGRFGYSFEKSDFNDVLEEVLMNLEPKIKTKNIKFLVSKPDKLPDMYLDKSKMTLVLQNLLENAMKYTPELGRVELIIKTEEKFIDIRVKDNGVGIPEEDQAKLFSKFFRATNVIRMQTEGSGLGLFIVRNVVEKHDGTIKCNSKEGKGTEFIIKLPIGGELKK